MSVNNTTFKVTVSPEVIANRRFMVQPSQGQLNRRLRDKLRIAEYKRRTHWVARSKDEYDSMHL